MFYSILLISSLIWKKTIFDYIFYIYIFFQNILSNHPLNIYLEKVPNTNWVYIFKTLNNKILYIWKAKNLKKRVSQYFNLWSVWKQDMLNKAWKIEWIETVWEQEALLLENNLIKQNQPPYNNLLKWDNSYTYIKITNEDFPLIKFTRFKDLDWSIYIWPKPFKKDLQKLLQFFRQFLKFRVESKTVFEKWKLSTDYFFWLDEWWSVYNKMKKWKSKKYLEDAIKLWFKPIYDYETAKLEYQKIIKLITNFFNWNTKLIEKKLLDEIDTAIWKQNYERAGKMRDIYYNIQKLIETQQVELKSLISGKFIKIENIWKFYLIIIIVFYEGKLLEIIRYHRDQDEFDIYQIVSDIIYEFGNLTLDWNLIEINNLQNFLSEDKKSFFLQTESIKKLPKKDEINILDLFDRNIKSYIDYSSFGKDNIMNEILEWIQKRYKLKNFPYNMECIDISHLSWWRITGWLSSMNGGIMNFKWYRKYNIQSWKNDDYKNLKEIIIRRFKLNKKISLEDLFVPDLFILDGWKWQLWVIRELYNEYDSFRKIYDQIDFISLWKWKARKRWGKIIGEKEKIYKFWGEWEILEKNLEYDNIDILLVRIRDEAHKLANKLRKDQMKKEIK